MTDKPPRRWFHFSLRTMFILMTLLCCWLGWELSIVRHRQATLRELQTKHALSITTANEYAARYPPGAPIPTLARISFVRRCLGDQAIQEIWHPPHQSVDDPDLKRLAEVYPEAELFTAHFEPCHPGCFPRGTLVETPKGPRPIETLQVGDALTIATPNGDSLGGTIQSIFVTTNRLWQIDTSAGSLITTETQPLCSPDGEAVSAGTLEPGDRVLIWQAGQPHAAEVQAVTQTDRTEQVFNLVVGNSEFFIAGGFLARSKPPAENEAGDLAEN